MKSKKSVLALAVALLLGTPAWASESAVQWLTRIETMRKKEPGAEAPWVVARVQSIDAQRGEVTIRHEAIPSIDMPAMTMTFPLADRAHLREMKAGDTMRFQAANQGGVVRIVSVRMEH